MERQKQPASDEVKLRAVELVTTTAAPLEVTAAPLIASELQQDPPISRLAQEPATRAPLEAAPAAPRATGAMTLLLLGVDERPDEVKAGIPGRTDAMLLLSVNFDHQKVGLASIPRDGYVQIPGYGGDRINSAYTHGEQARKGGGPTFAKTVVSQVFGTRVDRYVVVNVAGLERLIDGLGGVWVDNPKKLFDPLYPTDQYGFTQMEIPAGRQHLDGYLAVAYARMRHPDSDFGRQQRQQQVLTAMRNRFAESDSWSRFPMLLPEVLSLAKTDLSAIELLQLAAVAQSVRPERDLRTVLTDTASTPPFIGDSGAAYVRLTPGYRAAVAAAMEAPQAPPQIANAPTVGLGGG